MGGVDSRFHDRIYLTQQLYKKGFVVTMMEVSMDAIACV